MGVFRQKCRVRYHFVTSRKRQSHEILWIPHFGNAGASGHGRIKHFYNFRIFNIFVEEVHQNLVRNDLIEEPVKVG